MSIPISESTFLLPQPPYAFSSLDLGLTIIADTNF